MRIAVISEARTRSSWVIYEWFAVNVNVNVNDYK